MISLNNAIDKFIFKWATSRMLDPNSNLYIPKITLATVAELCDNDDDKTEMFWKCFNYAYPIYRQEQEEQQALEEAFKMLETLEEGTTVYHDPNCCPQCRYAYYKGYIKCPNCDYEE